MEKQLRIGISLQILFIFMFFAALLPGKIYGAIFALSISLYSLYSGVQSYRHQYKPALARVGDCSRDPAACIYTVRVFHRRRRHAGGSHAVLAYTPKKELER